MKAVTLLKSLTIIMAFLIVIGFIFVISKLSEKGQKIKSSSIVRSEMILDFPEKIREIKACGEKICLLTEGGKNDNRLIIVSPKDAQVTGIITFKEKEE